MTTYNVLNNNSIIPIGLTTSSITQLNQDVLYDNKLIAENIDEDNKIKLDNVVSVVNTLDDTYVTHEELNLEINELGILSQQQIDKVNELLPYNIGNGSNNSPIWSTIPTIGTDGVMEIGQYLDFHAVSNDAIDYRARIQASGINTLSMVGTGSVFTASTLNSGSVRTPLIKNSVFGADMLFRNSSDLLLLTLKNNAESIFNGEISTPTFSSINVVQNITSLNTDIQNTNNQLDTLQTNYNNTTIKVTDIEQNIEFINTDIINLNDQYDSVNLKAMLAIDYDKNKGTGIVQLPTWTDHGDGSLTVDDNGIFIYSDNPAGDGNFIRLTASNSATLTPTDQQTNYFYSFYNAGNPVYGFTLNPALFLADARYVPAARIIRDGNDLYTVDYSNYAISGTNKTIIKDVFVNGFQRVAGLVLSTALNRIVTVSGGAVYFGVNFKQLPDNTSGTNGILKEYYLISGIWNNTTVLAYDSIYYSDGTNRLTAITNKYTAKYFWRSISEKNYVYYIHGNQFNDLNASISEPVPIAPTFITMSSIYVGKIVIITNATNGTAYPVVWSGNINTAGATNHNDLSAIQGGTVSQYYHLNATDYTELSGRQLLTNSVYQNSLNSFTNVKLAIGMDGIVGNKEILMGRTTGTRNFGYIKSAFNAASAMDNNIEIGVYLGSVLKMLGDHTLANTIIRGPSFGTNLIQTGTTFYNHYIGFNTAGNVLCYVNGVLKAVIDSIENTDRWSTMRDLGRDTAQRVTAITFIPEVLEPDYIDQKTHISGDLSVAGVIFGTLFGSNTITHVTESDYKEDLEEGIFVETTGDIHYETIQTKYVKHVEIKTRPTAEPITYATYDEEGNKLTDDIYGVEEYEEITSVPVQGDEKNPYEDCICKVKRSNALNKNIVGVLTSINPVKFATHGDVLIKVVMDTYNLGDVIIPTINGYGKKASNGEIYDSMVMMIPRAKITSLLTKVPNTVSAILL